MAKTLGGFNKEFWLVNAIQFFDGLSYFSVIIVISMFLTDNVGFSDYDAGVWQGIFFLFITAFMFTVGSICDVIGDKKSFLFSTLLLLISRLGMGVLPGIIDGTALKITIVALLFVMALGTAMLVTITNTALRHFTNKDNRSKGFNLYYLIMNIGAMLAGVAVCDGFRNLFGPTSGNLAIFTFGAVMSAICFFCSYIINEDNIEEKDEDKGDDAEVKTPLKIFAEVWKEKAFQKLVLFLCLTLGVRLVFTHQTMVMPKYYLRTMFADFQLGAVNSLNPLIITVGLALTMNFIGKFNIVKLLVVGMTLSALSLLFLAFPGEWFLAIPGINNLDQAYRFVIIAQILVFAIGELIFSPRFTEYVASVAPKDKVASYMGLSALPMFVARPINGFVSGLLIANLCYDGVKAKIETGNIEYLESPEFMWMIYFILAIVSPIAVIALKRTLTQDNSEEAPKEEAKAEA
ncbi:MFS transporter [bacterium]|nr:MFS transporter [bacterium]